VLARRTALFVALSPSIALPLATPAHSQRRRWVNRTLL